MSDQMPPPPGPPMPPGGYPPPPPSFGDAASSGYSPVDAVKYGWDKFVKSPATLLLPVLLTLVVVGVIAGIGYAAIFGALVNSDSCTTVTTDTSFSTECSGGGFLLSMIAFGLLLLVAAFVGMLFQAGLTKGALAVTDGHDFSVGRMFDGWDKGKVVVAAILVAIGTAVGFMLCYIPGLIFGFLTQYTLYFVIDRQLSPTEAIKASISFTTAHLGETILFYLLAAVVGFVGALVCGVGLLVAIPVILVGQAYTYRRLNGEPVSATA